MTDEAGRPRAIWPALIFLLAVLPYANSPTNGFALDDLMLVRDNPELRSPVSWSGLFAGPYWPGNPAAALYRPVTIASLALTRLLFGPSALGFHAVNVLLHGLVCVLAWFAIRRLASPYGTAFLAAGWFALHPIHTEAVANIAGRAELLCAAAVLAGWLVHRAAVDARGAATVFSRSRRQGCT